MISSTTLRYSLCYIRSVRAFTAMAAVGASAHCAARGPTGSLMRRKKHATTCRAASSQSTWPRPQLLRRSTPACRAEERSRDSTKTSEAERLKAPDSPPAADTGRSNDVSYQSTAIQLKQARTSKHTRDTCRTKQVLLRHRLVIFQTS